MLKGMNVAANALEAESKQSIDIVYEDRDLAVIVKPSGMLTYLDEVKNSRLKQYCASDGTTTIHQL